MQKIYFDESGQTGTHLFDADQPFFCLGSTNIPDDEARMIVAEAFPSQQGPELKSQKLLKRPGGRRRYLEFAKHVASHPEGFCVSKIGKRFTIVSKMVDNFVEPLLSSRGYDFYADNYAYRFANSTGFAFENILERSVADNLLRLYNEFARQPNATTLLAIQSALSTAIASAPHGAGAFLQIMSEGADVFDQLHDLAAFEDTNDIHITAAVDCMGFWQARSPGPFQVIHDESLHFFSRSKRWEMITDPDLEPMVITSGPKTLKLPIPVTSTISARSHESPSLQLCDLVAGLVSRLSSPSLSEDFVRFRQEVIEAGFGEVSVLPVDFGDEFASGPPATSSGPDAMDRIAIAMSRRTRKLGQ